MADPDNDTDTPGAVGAGPISEILADNVARVEADASILETAGLLATTNMGVVLIGDEKQVTEIVSEATSYEPSRSKRTRSPLVP